MATPKIEGVKSLNLPEDAEGWLPILSQRRSWLVVAHMTPDGDTTGCALAMAHLLRALGAQVDVLCPDPFPAHYQFLAGAKDVWVDAVPPGSEQAGIVTVDFTDWGRIGGLHEKLGQRGPVVVIDHHVSNKRFGTYNLVMPEAAATGEVVFQLFGHFGVPISQEAAEALYTALVTDTGSFSYGATGAHTHLIAAQLIACGVNPARVNQQIFEQASISEVKLKSAAIEQMRLALDGQIAWTLISRQMLHQYGARDEDCDGIAERLRSIAGVDTSFFLREMADGRYKVSLRSKGAVDVNRVAAQFGGGGHLRAAGCTVDSPVETAVAQILDRVTRALTTL